MTDVQPQKIWPTLAARIAAAIALGVVVAALAYVCMELPRDLRQITPIWLANAVVLVALLSSDRSRWPLLVLCSVIGIVVASLHAGGHVNIILGLSVANVVEYLFCALILRRVLGRDIDVSRPRDLIWIGTICGFAAPLLSGSIAASVFYLARHVPFSKVMISWVLSNGLGLMLITPTLLAFRQARTLLAERPIRRGGWLWILALVLTILLVFTRPRYPMLFLIPPVLAFVALELEMLGAAIGIVILAGMSLAFTALNIGPVSLMAATMAERALLLQVFLVVSIFAVLPLAAISAQRRRLRDVAQEQTRLADMAEGLAGVGYWRLHLASLTVTWSEQMYVILGMEPGKPVTVEQWIGAIHRDDREAARLRYLNVLESFSPSPTALTRVVRASGEVRYVTGNMVVERDAEGRPVTIFGVIMDVTARKQAEQAILESEARFRMLAENGSDILAHSALDGRVTYVSPSVEHRLGYTPEDVVGRQFTDFVHPDDIEAVQAVVRTQFLGRGRALSHAGGIPREPQGWSRDLVRGAAHPGLRSDDGVDQRRHRHHSATSPGARRLRSNCARPATTRRRRPGQGRVPGQYEPRAADASDGGSGLHQAGRGSARTESGDAGLCRTRLECWQGAAGDRQRHP